jgi:hypothetical protein
VIVAGLDSREGIMKRALKWLALSVLTLAFPAVNARASIPTADGRLLGCYSKSDGSLRLVDGDSPACKKSERPVYWKQVGERGPVGAPGPKGDPGLQGPQGVPGVCQQPPSCAPGEVLVSTGEAQWGCRLLCSGEFVNAASDPLHCGNCESTCAAPRSCIGGICVTIPCAGPGSPGCRTYYEDRDGDGFGVGAGMCLCGPQGYYTAESDMDCNDNDPSVFPGAAEICDSKDNNCDGRVDELEDICGPGLACVQGLCMPVP